MTKRRAILEAVVARLAAIKVADGYATDAGEQIFLHEAPALGPDDPIEAIVVRVDTDVGRWSGENVLVVMPIEIQALARAGLDEAWAAAEDVLGDIKTAMEQTDRMLITEAAPRGLLCSRGLTRGATRTLPREEGSTTVGVGIGYELQFVEGWGQP